MQTLFKIFFALLVAFLFGGESESSDAKIHSKDAKLKNKTESCVMLYTLGENLDT